MASERVGSLQALRAAAASGVIVSHALERVQLAAHAGFDHSIDIGMIGVDVFFVLSGFIITRSAMEAVSAAGFFKRRWLRVAPLYYLMSTPMLLWLITQGEPYAHRLLATVLFWPVGPSSLVYPVLGVGWTLCFEMLFYTTVALLVRRSFIALAGLAALFLVFQAMRYVSSAPAWSFLGNPILLEFAFGAAMTRFPRNAGPQIGVLGLGMAGALIAAIGVQGMPLGNAGLLLSSRSFAGDLPWMRVVLFGGPAALLVWSALQLEPWFQGRAARLAAYIGDASYSLYLTHPLVLAGVFAAAALLAVPFPLAALFAIALSIAAGVLVYQWLELPLLRFLRRPGPRLAAT